jgi:hypothetical protein
MSDNTSAAAEPRTLEYGFLTNEVAAGGPAD